MAGALILQIVAFLATARVWSIQILAHLIAIVTLWNVKWELSLYRLGAKKNEWILPLKLRNTRRNLCRLFRRRPRNQALSLQDSNIWDLSRWWHIYGSMTFCDRTAPACIGDPHPSYLGNQSDDRSMPTSVGMWRHPASWVSSYVTNNWGWWLKLFLTRQRNWLPEHVTFPRHLTGSSSERSKVPVGPLPQSGSLSHLQL